VLTFRIQQLLSPAWKASVIFYIYLQALSFCAKLMSISAALNHVSNYFDAFVNAGQENKDIIQYHSEQLKPMDSSKRQSVVFGNWDVMIK
jgi:hypothetical protein